MQEALTLLSTGGNPALEAICREHGVRRLDLFGSRARGTAMDDADVDLLVEIETPTPAAYARAWFALKEQLETLFGRPVDLLTTGSLENPHLRQRVEAERITLFDAGSCS